MEAIVNKQINNKEFQLRTSFGESNGYGTHEVHIYHYQFEPEHEEKLREICHEENITLIEISNSTIDFDAMLEARKK